MCTAISYRTKEHYFGRNLDLEYSYEERVTVTPRNYPFSFRAGEVRKRHYAMIGMAYVVEGYPLYYEATNEKGLSMAGLNFPGNADYKEFAKEKDNVSPFELIPWILGQCKDVEEAKAVLSRINLWKEDFSPELPLSPLHWMISDRRSSITVECVREGLKIYENTPEVLTNNPTFDRQLLHWSDNGFKEENAKGLPGDYSSEARFVRAAYVKDRSVAGASERENVSQFFHILGSVEVPRGAVIKEDGRCAVTIYSCCCNTVRGIYYYKTYENSSVTAVDMYAEDLEGEVPVSYPLKTKLRVEMQN